MENVFSSIKSCDVGCFGLSASIMTTLKRVVKFLSKSEATRAPTEQSEDGRSYIIGALRCDSPASSAAIRKDVY